MYDSVPHTRPILVTGSMTDEQEGKAGTLLNPRRSTYQGPTSIINQVNEDLTEQGIQNTTLMAHLPQYVQLDEDHLGASRLLEVLCAVYNFPSDLAERSRGDQQYKDIEKAIDYGGEVGTLIKQLETYFDRVLSRTEGEEDPEKTQEEDADISLSADVQDFLNEMGERFEDDRSDPKQRN